MAFVDLCRFTPVAGGLGDWVYLATVLGCQSPAQANAQNGSTYEFYSVSAGVAVDSTNTVLMTLAASISKTTGAWAVGSGNGGLDTGAIANSTWYHVYVIERPDTSIVDVAFSLSATAPTIGGNIPAA